MKTKRLNRFAWIFLALTVAALSAVSSNTVDGKGRNRTANATCINQISGLSQDQKDQITALATKHQAAMNELRENRQSTTDVTQKDRVRKQMDTQIESHRNAVKALLTADQQKQFDQIPRNGNRQQNCVNQGNSQRGSGTCNGQVRGRRGR
ncbi:MAG TPA: hypothetical protein VFC65_03180 [Prolixibacteraceae bacterium]|nr:hypothetical protein [Prolixibacteraceae bacterium]